MTSPNKHSYNCYIFLISEILIVSCENKLMTSAISFSGRVFFYWSEKILMWVPIKISIQVFGKPCKKPQARTLACSGIGSCPAWPRPSSESTGPQPGCAEAWGKQNALRVFLGLYALCHGRNGALRMDWRVARRVHPGNAELAFSQLTLLFQNETKKCKGLVWLRLFLPNLIE